MLIGQANSEKKNSKLIGQANSEKKNSKLIGLSGVCELLPRNRRYNGNLIFVFFSDSLVRDVLHKTQKNDAHGKESVTTQLVTSKLLPCEQKKVSPLPS